jgi:hypothetical protein
MHRDPIVEEVRAIREAYAEQFNYDIRAMVADLKEKQKAHGRKLVSFPPKRITPVPVASEKRRAS